MMLHGQNVALTKCIESNVILLTFCLPSKNSDHADAVGEPRYELSREMCIYVVEERNVCPGFFPAIY